MAILPVSLLYRASPFGTAYGIGEGFAEKKPFTEGLDFTSGGSITFDLILEENHLLENDVTEHAVENRTPISDHIRNKLRTGTMTGLISNFSLNSFIWESGVVGALAENVRTQKAYDVIVDLWKKRVPVDIVTVLEVYKNVVITNVNLSRDGDTGDAQEFQISFKEIEIRKLEKVSGVTKINVGDMNEDINRQVALKTEVGRQVADFQDASLGFSILPPGAL
jgi:hypothetical protein